MLLWDHRTVIKRMLWLLSSKVLMVFALKTYTYIQNPYQSLYVFGKLTNSKSGWSKTTFNNYFWWCELWITKFDKRLLWMWRHKNIDCFYLCQTYTNIAKHLTRDNANMIVAFKQDEMDLRHIYNDHDIGDMSFHQLLDMCDRCWKDK